MMKAESSGSERMFKEEGKKELLVTAGRVDSRGDAMCEKEVVRQYMHHQCR